MKDPSLPASQLKLLERVCKLDIWEIPEHVLENLDVPEKFEAFAMT